MQIIAAWVSLCVNHLRVLELNSEHISGLTVLGIQCPSTQSTPSALLQRWVEMLVSPLCLGHLFILVCCSTNQPKTWFGHRLTIPTHCFLLTTSHPVNPISTIFIKTDLKTFLDLQKKVSSSKWELSTLRLLQTNLKKLKYENCNSCTIIIINS